MLLLSECTFIQHIESGRLVIDILFKLICLLKDACRKEFLTEIPVVYLYSEYSF